MRRAAKRDDNEALIVTALQSAGWTVVRVSDAGAPDLLCAKDGRLQLVEVKGPKGTLTETQKVAFTRLATAGVLVQVVRSPGEALEVLGTPRHLLNPNVGPQWIAVNGSPICESCWLPDDGLHAKDCPNRTRLKPKPAAQSAHRAAKKMEEAMPQPSRKTGMRVQDGVPDECDCVHFEPFPPPLRGGKVVAEPNCMRCKGRATRRPSRGVEGELQPLKGKR